MSKQTEELLELIDNNKTLNEISKALGISNSQVFMKISMLRQKGYVVDKNYYYSGEIKYQFQNPFIPKDKILKINVPNSVSTIRALLTSDTHFGNVYDAVESIPYMIDYCKRENIHIILNAGDFFEGSELTGKKRVKMDTAEEQIKYTLKAYPYEKDILTFVLLGNHDASFYLKDKIDIKTILESRRHDIIPIGYGYGYLSLGGYLLKMEHPTKRKDLKIPIPTDSKKCIILKGHSHRLKIDTINNQFIRVNVPTQSYVKPSGEDVLPSIVDMQLEVRDNQVCSEVFRQHVFVKNKYIQVGEYHTALPLKKSD